MAGVHYRTNSFGFQIGEEQAIGILRDYSETYNERFNGFSLTKFDSQRTRILDGQVLHV